MRVVLVNYFHDPYLATPEALLERYDTLTGWADGLVAAGAAGVSVVQGFHRDAEVERNGVSYHFVHETRIGPNSLTAPQRIHERIVALQPEVVHVNGLQYAGQAWRLKRRLPGVPVVVQDHANAPPLRAGPRRWMLCFALRRLDAVFFAARELAQPWREAGFLRPETPVYEIMEGSSRFCLKPRQVCRARTGLSGGPLCLWVGRLNGNKDPLTVLQGFADALTRLPGARLAMAYSECDLLGEVRAWLETHPLAAARVTLLGTVPHRDLEAVYNSADLFVLGSHHEGSGYAVLEALSCGVLPVVTDIPSFRALTDGGRIGALWPVGNVAAFSDALITAHDPRRRTDPETVCAFFDERFSFASIGRQALAAYRSLLPAGDLR